ncbi:MAG: hypothetical protein Q7R70_01460 [Candidatus Diapherotrites archaeon]|nr:hypothetical protein [Candidatus Diapherotrites archaeon]
MNGRILVILAIIFSLFVLSVSVIAAAGGKPEKPVVIDETLDTNQEAREHFLSFAY